MVRHKIFIECMLDMSLTLLDFLFVVVTLFGLGLFGIICVRKNIIVTLLSIELMLLAVNLNFILLSAIGDDVAGQVFALFILTVAAAEAALGLAILVAYYRVNDTVAMDALKIFRAVRVRRTLKGTKITNEFY